MNTTSYSKTFKVEIVVKYGKSDFRTFKYDNVYKINLKEGFINIEMYIENGTLIKSFNAKSVMKVDQIFDESTKP